MLTELRCYPTVVGKALAGRVKREGELWGSGSSASNNLMLYSLTDGGGAYVVADGTSCNTSCEVSLDLSGSRGLIVSRGSERTKDLVCVFFSFLFTINLLVVDDLLHMY